jgi:hypothetical protein
MYGETTSTQTRGESRWNKVHTIDLSSMTKAKCMQLRKVLEANAAKIKAGSARLREIDQWLAILDGKLVRCHKIMHFAPQLKQYLKDAPKHWIYQKRNGDVWQPYYVGGIKFVEAERSRDYTHPAHVIMTVWWEELGKLHSSQETFYQNAIEDLTPPRILADRGYLVETEDMLAEYEKLKKKYALIHDKVGLQFEAVGVGTNDVDDREERWYGTHSIRMDKDGEPARVVIDVLTEGDKERSSGRGHPPDATFWSREGCDYKGKEDDDDDEIEPGDEETDFAAPEIQVPLAPALVCFDLKRQVRLRLHVDQLTEYQYKTDLADKLILPDEVRNLVDLLVSHKSGFKDIIGGKGYGAVVLCAGPPGTGKTLNSEAMKRPLYSVQCSQLGLSPKDLEKQLLLCFSRATRWNAILLLDEADVYVATRGSDLEQNAIVGVFLRVLEYYQGVLFMTTNRADLVDDAIASRCLARIVYKTPSLADQKRIWRVLADTAGIELPKAEIDKIAEKYPNLSGRDVKNLMKLAHMVSLSEGTRITSKTIDFVKQFKPTQDPSEFEPEFRQPVKMRGKRRTEEDDSEDD